jgi:hypothetical protein
MMPSFISRRIVVDRLALVDEMLVEIRALSLADQAAFFADRRNTPRQNRICGVAWKRCSILGVTFWQKGLASASASIKRSPRGLKIGMSFLQRMQICCV